MQETLTSKISRTAKKLPSEVMNFMIKGAAFFLVWCLLYCFLLKPYHLVDPILTRYTGKATMYFMQYLFRGQHYDAVYTPQAVMINIDNKRALSIWDPCNGLDLYVLFAGFIVCIPMGIRKMTGFILIGVFCIFILNVSRCLALVYLFYHHSGYADIAHHYFFQMIVYAAIFILWDRYFRSLKLSNETAKV